MLPEGEEYTSHCTVVKIMKKWKMGDKLVVLQIVFNLYVNWVKMRINLQQSNILHTQSGASAVDTTVSQR